MSAGDDEIGGLVRTARRWAAVLALCSVTPVAWRFLGSVRAVGWGLLGLTFVVAAAAIIAVGRPLQRRTGFDTDFMVGRVWLVGFFAIVMPIGLLGIVLGIWHLRTSSIGGYQTTRKGGGRQFYPERALPLGEGKPLGWTLLVLGTLWPAALLATLWP